MPRISVFYGIIIAMYFNDHSPPHFHAIYGGHEAKVSIATGFILEGEIPARAKRLVKQWSELHRSELKQNWESARTGESLATIEPLP